MNGTLFSETELRPFRFTRPADQQPDENHVYVVAISSGVTKVGFSIRPKDRILSHVTAAIIHGASITAAWVSIPHGNAKDNEKALIQYCRDRAAGQFGAEYFTGLAFADVVEYAESLDYQRLPGLADRLPRIPATYSLDEVAEKHGLSAAALHEFCRAGKVRHFPGRQVRLMTQEHIDELLGSAHYAELAAAT